MDAKWDCVVVGGGAAGLSAALVLGRARKRTLVVDAGRQSNLSAPGIGGLLGHDGLPPAELYAAARRELEAYPAVEFRAGEVVTAKRDGEEFELELADGSGERTRRLVLAPGMDYRHAEIPGIAERWGRSAFHCPFCHGWEVRDRTLGVLDSGGSGAERALLLRSWSEDVTLFTNGPADLDGSAHERLREAGVAVEERPVSGLLGPGDELAAIALADGAERDCAALLVAVTLHQRSPLPRQLGLELAEPGGVVADAIEVDKKLATSVDGVFAAGDTSTQMPSVANAVGAGSMAAASVVHSLI